MLFLRSLMVSLLSFLLTACLSRTPYHVPSEFRPQEGQASGWLVGTIGVDTSGDDKSQYSMQSIYYRLVGSEEETAINYANGMFIESNNSYEDESNKLISFAIPLRQGEYEIFNTQFFLNLGQLQTTTRGQKEFSIPFKIYENQVTYLGRFISHGAIDKNVFGVPIFSRLGWFSAMNAFDEDKNLIHQRFPNLKDLNFTSGFNCNNNTDLIRYCANN